MPIFEYQCKKCGTKFEELVQGDREAQIPCPECGNNQTEKLVSAIGGIAMGKSTAPPCGSQCSSAGSCGMQGSCCGG